MFKTALAPIAVGMMAIAAPASADSFDAPKVDIQYRDLNLATAEGQEILQRRIDRAAIKVCQLDEHRTGTRIPSAERKACFAKARASAGAQMASIVADYQLGG